MIKVEKYAKKQKNKQEIHETQQNFKPAMAKDLNTAKLENKIINRKKNSGNE